MNNRQIDYIVVHVSATREGQAFDVSDIRAWHKNRGWEDVGYHYVIKIDGEVQVGRPEWKVGAHVAGHNSNSIGICLIGGLDAWGNPKDTRTAAQTAALIKLIRDLLKRYPGARVLGHRDFPGVTKACPCFDVIPWWNSVTEQPDIVEREYEIHADGSLLRHEVREGETLLDIAKRYSCDPKYILCRAQDTEVYPGAELFVFKKGGFE